MVMKKKHNKTLSFSSDKESNQKVDIQDKLLLKDELIATLRDEISSLASTISEIKNSKCWRWTKPIRLVYDILLKPSAKTHYTSDTTNSPEYIHNWDHKCFSKNAKKPLISILTPVYKPPVEYLKKAIESVKAQCYDHWELVFVHDGPPDKKIAKLIESYAINDRRIRFDTLTKHGGISKATNRALSIADGSYIALLDQDDLLDPRALCEVAKVIGKDPDVDMIFTDEDKVDETDKHYEPFFKPGWSPELLLSQMYTCHFSIYRKTLAQQIGGLRNEFDSSQDHDFVLRFTEKTNRIHHIPRVLYHWRAHPDSAAQDIKNKPTAFKNTKNAIQAALKRRCLDGIAETANKEETLVRTRLIPSRKHFVSIIIPTRDSGKMLEECIGSILNKSTYETFEIIVIDNGSKNEFTLKLIENLCKRRNIKSIKSAIKFNHSKLCNLGASEAAGDTLIFLNDDTVIITPSWIEEMLGFAEINEIGAVGCMLLYQNNSVQHAGVIIGMRGLAGHLFRYHNPNSNIQYGRLRVPCNYSAVTAACLMIEKDKFVSINGFDTNLPSHFNDVDLCLRLMDKGYRNTLVPAVKVTHIEKSTRRDDHTMDKAITIMKKKWGRLLNSDPHYNPNFSLETENADTLPSPRY